MVIMVKAETTIERRTKARDHGAEHDRREQDQRDRGTEVCLGGRKSMESSFLRQGGQGGQPPGAGAAGGRKVVLAQGKDGEENGDAGGDRGAGPQHDRVAGRAASCAGGKSAAGWASPP